MNSAAVQRQPNRPKRRLLQYAVAVLCAFVALVAALVINNNYSLHRYTRAEMNARIDAAIESSTQWIVAHPDIQGNPSVMYMVGDMANMSRDPRLQQYVQNYLTSGRWTRVPGRPVTWYYARMVDESAPVPLLLAEETPAGEVGWDAYAVAPERLQAASTERAALFSTKYIWGLRNHQLLALDMYQHFNGPSAELDAIIQPVAEGVARDAFWDFRVSDSYEQRSAFLLNAGRPDLVRSRWIERVLDNQHADGAWNFCWYGWCRGVFEFRSGAGDRGHSTVQAAWALYQLKYRYSDWVKEHYQ